MALDPSIYSLFAPKSVNAYQLESQNLANSRSQGDLAALNLLTGKQNMQERQRSFDEQDALRKLAGTWSADTTPEQQISDLRNRGFATQADAREKSYLERKKTDVGIDETKAKTKGEEAKTAQTGVETAGKVAQQYRDRLTEVQTPDQYVRHLKAQYDDPILGPVMVKTHGDFMTAAQNIPTDPAQFGAFVQKVGMGMDKFIADQTTKRGQDKTAETSAANAKLAADTSRANNQATVGATVRGQNIARDTALQGGSVQLGADGSMVVVPNKFVPGQPVQSSPVMGPGGQPMAGKTTPAPQFAIEGAQKAVKALTAIDSTIKLLGTPEGDKALGLKNMAPGAIGRAAVNKFDPRGVDARAAVADIGSLEIKDRSGATVTIGEEPRLLPFIPVPTDSAEVATKKLKRLREAVDKDYQTLGEFYPGVKAKGDAAMQKASGGATGGWSITPVQ